MGLDQLLTVVLGLGIFRVGQSTSSPFSSPPMLKDDHFSIALASLLLAAMNKGRDQFPAFIPSGSAFPHLDIEGS